MTAALRRHARWLRYLTASVAALGLDFALFLVLLGAGTPAWAASAGGYASGIAAHWLLSSRGVFADRIAAAGPARRRQQALFLASAFVGLAVTTGTVGLGATLGLDPRLAKAAAVALSFQAVWLLRRHVVFAA